MESEVLAASGSRLAGGSDTLVGAEEDADAASSAHSMWREPPTFALIPKNQLGEICLDTARLRAAGITDRLDVEKMRVYLLLLVSNIKDALLLEPFAPRRADKPASDTHLKQTHSPKGKARNQACDFTDY